MAPLICDECGIEFISVKAERLVGVENDVRDFTTRMIAMNYGWVWTKDNKDICPSCMKSGGFGGGFGGGLAETRFERGRGRQGAMFDRLLRFFASADLVGVVKATTTRGATVLVHRECGMSGHNIKRLLRWNGVKVEHILVITHQNLLRIVVDDYDKAVRVLGKAGIRRS